MIRNIISSSLVSKNKVLLALTTATVMTLGLASSVSADSPTARVYVATNGTDSGTCLLASPCSTINYAVKRLPSAGGTVHVEQGSYNQGISFNDSNSNIEVVSDADVNLNNAPTITLAPDLNGFGVDIEQSSNITIKGFKFVVNADSNISYALHAYQSSNLTIQRDSFTGAGSSTPKSGGVDINSSPNVKIQNVSSDNFYKNGFSLTAKYLPTDPTTSNVVLNKLTADNNGWNGIAFYTVGNDHSKGDGSTGGSANISNVTFGWTNEFKNDAASGVFIEGDSDLNVYNSSKPANTVTGENNTDLNIKNATFSNDGRAIFNYQTANVQSFGSVLDGINANKLTTSNLPANQVVDYQTNNLLGSVIFADNEPSGLSPEYGAVKKNAGTLTWNSIADNVGYNYESSNSKNTNSDGSLSSVIYGPVTLTSPSIDASNTLPGTYYWQVRAVYANGETGKWSDPQKLVVKP